MSKKMTFISWAVSFMRLMKPYKFKVIGHECIAPLLVSGKKILFIIDHADLYPILLLFLMSNKEVVPFKKCITIVSGSKDGDIAKFFLEKKNIKCITKDQHPGTSSSDKKYGLKIKERFHTIREFLKNFKNARSSFALMVINEKTTLGLPRVTRSSWVFAKNVECEIIPVCSLSKAEIILNSNWDLARIPTPFSTVNFILGAPVPFSDFDNCVSKDCESQIISRHISNLRKDFIAYLQQKKLPQNFKEI